MHTLNIRLQKITIPTKKKTERNLIENAENSKKLVEKINSNNNCKKKGYWMFRMCLK